MCLELGACPALVRAFCRAGEPVLDDAVHLILVAGEGEVAQAQDAIRLEDAGDALERERLPEIGQVMERVARVDVIGHLASVFVAEEARLHALDVRHAQANCLGVQHVEHRSRHVDGNHAPTVWSGG